MVVLQTPTKANKCIPLKGVIQNHEDSYMKTGVSYRRCTEDLPGQLSHNEHLECLGDQGHWHCPSQWLTGKSKKGGVNRLLLILMTRIRGFLPHLCTCSGAENLNLIPSDTTWLDLVTSKSHKYDN